MHTLKNLIRIGSLLAMTIIAVPTFTADAEAAYACKGNQYSGAATKRSRFMARAMARKSWEGAMKNQFGLAWSVWSIAAGKSISCHMTGSRHTCLALARPCKYVVQ